MGVRLSEDEAWSVIEAAHTGILTTLRRDGSPIALPVWFVAFDRRVYVSTPPTSKKVSRIRHDPRASFLVESGELWEELEAVHLSCTASVIDDDDLVVRVGRTIDAKYAAVRTDPADMPATTREHYASRTFIELVPDGRILSWDNRRLRRDDR